MTALPTKRNPVRVDVMRASTFQRLRRCAELLMDFPQMHRQIGAAAKEYHELGDWLDRWLDAQVGHEDDG